jgi:hypothetical protein
VLADQIADRQTEFFAAGQSFDLGRLPEQLGGAQVVLRRQGQALLDQSRGPPASLLNDAGIHRPEMRWHEQTAQEHHQPQEGTNQ